MRMIIDTEARTINGEPLYSKESFELLSDLWLKVGWELKLPYTYTWLGFPVLQLPDDLIRIQEVIVRLKPDVIVETGIAHGGSLIYYASLCKIMGHGRVIGIEKGLRCRSKIEAHPLSYYISMIEGDSVDPQIVRMVHQMCHGLRVMVILDSNHERHHVYSELMAYSDLIAPGYYIVACDGNLRDLADVPRGSIEWKWNNPQEAAKDFACRNPQFVIEEPSWPFNESQLSSNVTYWPSAWLRRQGD